MSSPVASERGSGAAQLIALLAAHDSPQAVHDALTAELLRATGGSRIAVLVLDAPLHLRLRSSHGLPRDATSLEVDLAGEPMLRETLASGVVRWLPPAFGVAFGPGLRRAFRAGRSLLLVPLPCGVGGDGGGVGGPGAAVGIAIVEGAPAELPATSLARSVELSCQLAIVLSGSLLAERAGLEQARDERVRLATELHDGVLQQLFSVQLKMRELAALLPVDGQIREAFDRTAAEVAASSRDLRTAVVGLTASPPRLAPVRTATTGNAAEVNETLQKVLVAFGERTGASWDLEFRGADGGSHLSVESASLFLRAVKEGLTNVHKHAQATQVLVVVRRGPSWWTIEVHDDGLTDANVLRRTVAGSTRGFGLKSLADAAAARGGRVWVGQSSELMGVQLSMSLPVGDEGGS